MLPPVIRLPRKPPRYPVLPPVKFLFEIQGSLQALVLPLSITLLDGAQGKLLQPIL